MDSDLYENLNKLEDKELLEATANKRDQYTNEAMAIILEILKSRGYSDKDVESYFPDNQEQSEFDTTIQRNKKPPEQTRILEPEQIFLGAFLFCVAIVHTYGFEITFIQKEILNGAVNLLLSLFSVLLISFLLRKSRIFPPLMTIFIVAECVRALFYSFTSGDYGVIVIHLFAALLLLTYLFRSKRMKYLFDTTTDINKIHLRWLMRAFVLPILIISTIGVLFFIHRILDYPSTAKLRKMAGELGEIEQTIEGWKKELEEGRDHMIFLRARDEILEAISHDRTSPIWSERYSGVSDSVIGFLCTLGDIRFGDYKIKKIKKLKPEYDFGAHVLKGGIYEVSGNVDCITKSGDIIKKDYICWIEIDPDWPSVLNPVSKLTFF